MKATMYIKKIITKLKCWKCGINSGGGWIHPLAEIKKYENGEIAFGENVILHKGVRIDAAGKIILGMGTDVNTYTRIESASLIEIGKDVLIGPNVYISDRSHQYKDVDVPIKMQGYYTRGNLKIGNGTWIGIHACVIGNVEVGKGCVIGANAVVTKNIPDYCVVVGNPARIVKRYDFKEKKWIKMDENKTI